MSTRVTKSLVSAIGIFLFVGAYLFAYEFILKPFLGTAFIPLLIVTLISIVGGAYFVLMLVDKLLPKDPVAAFSTEEGQGLLSSKTFWFYIAMLVFSVANHLVGAGLTEANATEIINLDWSNVALAISSTVIIVLKNFNVFNLFVPTKGNTNTE